jgi:ferredoxin
MILEEVEEGQPNGVYVLELAEEGSATSCPEVVGMKLRTVMDENVGNMLFDDVMAKLIEAPSPVSISFLKEGRINDALDTGTPVKIKVIDEGKEVEIDAKVGDNLRQVLLENDLEVYKGLKAKLGNCGGGGQCGHCSVELLEDEWEARSDYEDKKLKSSNNARLSCLNNIQGPATIKL